MDGIDLTGLNQAEVLAALYNAARPVGMGMLHYDPKLMTTEEAQQIIDEGGDIGRRRRAGIEVVGSNGVEWSVDYVRGRPLKLHVRGNVLHGAWLYDRDQGGAGTCERIIAELRSRTVSVTL